MEQLDFTSAPVLDSHVDFAHIAREPRIADIEIVRRLHRREFKPMNANDRTPGELVVYRIEPAVQAAPEAAPRPQTTVEPEPVKMISAERRRARLAEVKAVNALALDGREILQPWAAER